MKKTALPPVPLTSVFHPNNQQVARDKIVMDAAEFFDRLDRGGRRINVITSSGVRPTKLRTRR